MNAGSPTYYIPPEPGRWEAPLLAVLMHCALFAFFYINIDWHNEVPLAIEAEVWDIKVREAAPKAEVVKVAPTPIPTPPPPPPPEVKKVEETQPKVDIALEREKERKKKEKLAHEKQEKLEAEKKKLAEQKKLEDEKEKEKERKLAELADKKKLLAEKKAKEAKEAAAVEKQRAEDMRRIMGNAGSGGTGTAARSTSPRGDPSYAAAVIAKIKSNVNFVGDRDMPGNPEAEFKITLSPSGEVWNVKKTKSSGIPAYDLAVENAINKSSPLPRKKDGTVDREVTAIFKLKD
ncbi:MAG: cell envelope integrity protein TolA [Burkholderiales bacterium]|nr:cell envelope integrity protein TolA [Burkholderiales bacterium]